MDHIAMPYLHTFTIIKQTKTIINKNRKLLNFKVLYDACHQNPICGVLVNKFHTDMNIW